MNAKGILRFIVAVFAVSPAAAAPAPQRDKAPVPVVNRAPVPPAPLPAPKPNPPDADHPVTAAPPPRTAFPRATALFIVEANVEAGLRHFAYTDRITPTLRPYDLFAAPLAAIHAELYPLARVPVLGLNGLGIVGGYSRAFALASADAGGSSVDTSWQSFDIGGRERVAVGSNVLLGANAGYGGIDFKFGAPPFTAALPSVGYRFVRAGVDARGQLGSFSVFGGGSYLVVLSAADIEQLFPREHVAGFEATVGVGWQLAPGWELSVALDYARFFYSMNPVPGDPYVAGGALDEMARLSLGLSYLL